MATKIQFRRGTATQWSTANPVLADGEVGYETDTGNIKIGTGVSGSGSWNNLPYYQLPNVSVNPSTTADLNNAAYRVMGRYRLNSVTGGTTTWTNAPGDFAATIDADSVSTLVVTTHAYSALTTVVQQTLTQFSANNTDLKQWVRVYDGTNWTGWTSTAHLSDNEVTFAKMQDIAGLSVIGKTGSGSGDPAEITAATSGHVLRYDGTNVAFGTLASTAFDANTDVPLTALADQAALSVVANGTGTSAAPTAIEAAADGHVLRRVSSTSLGFGTIDNSSIAGSAGIALSKLATQAATTFVANSNSSTALAPTAVSAANARTMLGLGTMYDQAKTDYGATNINQVGCINLIVANGPTVSGQPGTIQQTISGAWSVPNASGLTAYLRPAAGTWDVWQYGSAMVFNVTSSATNLAVGSGGPATRYAIAIRTA